MNKREARVYALYILKEMIWAEIYSPTANTTIDTEGAGMFELLGLKSKDDMERIREALIDIAETLSNKIERSGIELPGVTAG